MVLEIELRSSSGNQIQIEEFKIIVLSVYFRMASRLVLFALLVVLVSISAELKVIAIGIVT